MEPEQPECWMLPPTEMEAAVGADAGNQGGRSTGLPSAGMDHKQLEAGVRAERTAVEKWFDLHANDAFVPVKIKRITKASKFDGAKPGWVFKTGDSGLGYYRDSGGLRTHLSLDLALRPMRSLPAATINLDDLVISDTEGDPGSF